MKPKSVATVTPKTVQPQKTVMNAKSQAKSPQKPTAKLPIPNKTSKPVKTAGKIDASKKKSIFSPENSSEESDVAAIAKQTAIKTQLKQSQKPRSKAAARPVEKPKVMSDKPKPEKPPVKSKPIASSASSATTSTETSSSSDSDSSTESVKKNAKKPVRKTTEKEQASDSETENQNQVTRKLTRSASARKSKYLFGKSVDSDTDSDTESTKRSLSRSPVKRAPTVAKGKTKNSKQKDTKSRFNDVLVNEERKCPLEGCNSTGHLSGKHEKHFTIEACPFYHNMGLAHCKEQAVERKKREDFRKKALEVFRKTPKGHTTPEMKQYLQKVKDMRAKFKPEIVEDVKPNIDKSKEPDLSNFVPDYDLKLFRDAQAIASEKIEEDLKSQPNTKGTKYIEMGKFEMEVWYQSPYPEDYARLPKLYICEFCLRYMKSRTILQRHAYKCVWRHPPGEEVSFCS